MRAEIPEDLLPARMLNEVTYCPRLFWYEFVEGLFIESADTIDGKLKHASTDEASSRRAPAAARKRRLKDAESADSDDEIIHSTSVTLSSSKHGIIAKIDLVETGPDGDVPVEYKRGRAPRTTAAAPTMTEDDELAAEPLPQAWEADLVQLAAQVLVLEENGRRVPYGIISYLGSRTRVRVSVDDELRARALRAVEKAREIVAADEIPEPLVDDPRCVRCSLLPICMPEETARMREIEDGSDAHLAADAIDADFDELEEPSPIRRIVAARDEEGALYVNTQGARIGKSGEVLTVSRNDEVLGEVPLGGLRQVNIFGNIQITTQAMQETLRGGVPVCFFSMRGYFYGMAAGLPLKNVMLRIRQFRAFDDPESTLAFARQVVAAKISNQRTILLRNISEPGCPEETARELKRLRQSAVGAKALDSLLGIEGQAARIYFEHFAKCIKVNDETGTFDFEGRNRRPPRDPVNALLSLAYAMLVKDITVVLAAVGFDPMYGFYHQPRFGRPALALDLMEEFRPLISDSTVLSLVNNRMLSASDFVRTEGACALTDVGRAKFFEAYERRKDTLVTHPVFGYRLSYHRMLEIQARILARVIEGELPAYRGFTTR